MVNLTVQKPKMVRFYSMDRYLLDQFKGVDDLDISRLHAQVAAEHGRPVVAVSIDLSSVVTKNQKT